MDSIIVENLTKKYGQVRALHNVSFRLGAGEIFGYLGPNGAGKTTTLRVILGLVHASGGRVNIFGSESMKPSVHEKIGYVPGEVRLYGNMTGREVLHFYGGFRPHHPPILQAQLLKAFDLSAGDLERRVKFLSHGTRQKLGLIVAMQHDPDLLLLDEPTTGLDPLVQNSFREQILDFARRGRSILLSSHILSEIEEICDRIAILRAGEIVTVESIEQLRTNMIRRLQVRFRGQVPENLAAVPGITNLVTSGKDITIWVRGDVNPLLRRIATGDIEHFVFSEPDLEEIFLGYYHHSS